MLDPDLEHVRADREDFAADAAVIEEDLFADAGVGEDLGKRASDPRRTVGIGREPVRNHV